MERSVSEGRLGRSKRVRGTIWNRRRRRRRG